MWLDNASVHLYQCIVSYESLSVPEGNLKREIFCYKDYCQFEHLNTLHCLRDLFQSLRSKENGASTILSTIFLKFGLEAINIACILHQQLLNVNPFDIDEMDIDLAIPELHLVDSDHENNKDEISIVTLQYLASHLVKS